MKPRPIYLDLFLIRLPLPGFVSILHRISGFMLYLSIPLLLYLLQDSLSSEAHFSEFRTMLSSLPARLGMIFLTWALSHHVLAGIRVLLLDIDIGISLQSARRSSKWVLAASLLTTLIASLWLV